MRFLLSIPVAALAVLGLFYLMTVLIKQPLDELPPPTPRETIVITAKIKDTPPTPTPPKPDPLPDPPPQDPPDTQPGPRPDPVSAPGPEPGTNPDPQPLPIPGSEFIVTPIYPERCASTGAEGTVVVSFDVLPDGTATNIEIVETPNPCFRRAVTQAIQRSRFAHNPGGKRTQRTERFIFVLEE